jgi:hypothetical protein
VALSKKRADAAMNYYIYEKKVNKNRLVPKAYGTSQPAASNVTADGKDNPAGRALNRRTEFKIIGELKPEDIAKNAAEAKSGKKDNTPVAKVIKKDISTGKTIAPSKPKADNAPANTPAVVTGLVYIEKGGKRSLVNQAAVFLTSNEGGFQQKVFYVKADGSYNFDLSHSKADTFKLIARKYSFESNEIVFTPEDVKTSTKPIDLIIKMK